MSCTNQSMLNNCSVSLSPFLLATDILIVSGTPLSSTSLNISWTLEPSFTATGYIISYSNTNPGCFSDTRSGIYTWRTSYELTGLQEATEYSVNVTVTLSWSGRTEQFSTEATTMFAG